MAGEEPELWEAIVTLVAICLMFIVLAIDKLPADFVMFFTVTLLIPTGIISLKESLVGFSNEGMLTVMVLFMISAGVESSGALEHIKSVLFYKYSKKEPLAFTLLRICLLLAVLSAFLNNTPVVAIFIPVLDDFCKKNDIAPSKVMMPLSYAVILGGTLTTIGTSTNLVAIGLASSKIPDFDMNLFAMARVGLPVLIGGMLYIMTFGPILLPDRGRRTTINVLDNPREYVVSLKVDAGSSIAGRSIEEAGLRRLDGLFLVHINRGEEGLPAPAPETTILEGDVLVFAGDVETVVALTRMRGLSLVEDPAHKDLADLKGNRLLVEAVVGNHTSIVGKSVRELQFRSTYEAAIIAVHRNGEHVQQSLGDIVLHAGDALLVVTGPKFVETFGHRSSVFALVRPLGEYVPPTFNYRSWLSLVIVLAVIIVSSAADISILLLAFFGVALMMFFGIVNAQRARASVNLEVLIMIVAGFALSTALTNSGAAKMVADALIAAALPGGVAALLTMFYVVAVIFNAVVTNNAAVAIMFPIAFNIYEQGIVDLDTMLFVLMFAGSADFATPIGYQTNLMVMAPGGYKFLDYTRFGLPLQVIAGFFCIIVAVNLDHWWVIMLITLAIAVLFLGIAFAWRRWVGEPVGVVLLRHFPWLAKLRIPRRRRASSDDGDSSAHKDDIEANIQMDEIGDVKEYEKTDNNGALVQAAPVSHNDHSDASSEKIYVVI